MLYNYLIIAFRNLKKQKIYSAINICGLSIGIACAILIYFFIRHEMTFDRFHPNHAQIYRIAVGINFRGLEYWTTSPYPLANAIVEEVPGVDLATQWIKETNKPVRFGDEMVEYDVHLTDAAFFDMFNFPLLTGDPKQIVSDPNGLIISTRIKERYFSEIDPIGKTLSIKMQGNEYTDFMISGVAAPIPENSSIQFDLLLSSSLYQGLHGTQAMNDWFPKTAIVTFVQTSSDIESLSQHLEQLAETHQLGQIMRTTEVEHKFRVQALQDMHFDTEIRNTVTMLAPGGDPAYSYILGGVALFILAIACINFMNLSVGLSIRRTREVGIRKVFGAARFQLMKQFWAESCLLTGFALVLGIGFSEALLPVFNELTSKQLDLDYFTNPVTMLVLGGMALCVGLIAGLYPAFILSGFQPARIFSDKITFGGRRILFRSMVVFQFMLAILLIACTLFMSNQLRYMTSFGLGWNPQNVVYLPLSRGVEDAVIERFRQDVMQHSDVVNVASGRATLFGETAGSIWSVSYQGESTTLPVLKADYEFLDVLGMDLLDGRNFLRERPSDKDFRIIVNERFVERFGLTDPVDKEAPFGLDSNPIIIGVVRDFHFMSLRHTIEPMALYLRPDSPPRQVFIKLASMDDLAGTIRFLQEKWDQYVPGVTFNYTMLEDEVSNQYSTEENFRRIITTTSYFGIVIACMGLFGMTSLSVARRTKEMGIRKVLGATSTNILSLFNQEYIWLIALANIFAWPIVYYAIQDWLQHFIYRISMDPLIFLVSGLIPLTLAVVTISLQAHRVVKTDPISTLRYE